MKLSFSTLGCPDWTVKQIVGKAVQYGFNGVELRVDDKHISPNMDVVERKRTKKLFADEKLDICCLAGYSWFCSDRREELEENKALLIQIY